ncbi:hypothetical protein RND71_036714 [Anisodus tanguticus]|uniref:F-box domain-containing protein n=1 Tax=Anisodus tanguticus TaxID=243964 RepID=A0AAE1R1P2_9SOLA|nr:hypothetical protein RND71_036714 [Anisodus tanguticus]
MSEFTERVGWKLHKRVEELISEFCSKIGVDTQIFKVWLQNNKKNSTLGKRDQPTIDILPECIIHKILCYFTFEEPSQIRILSKTWLRAWATYPNLKFRVKSFYGVINIVDKTMETYRDGKIPIEKFELTKYSHSVCKREIFQIDKWLGFALQNGVKDLEFMKVSICSGQSLRILKLRNCESIGAIDAPNLVSLEYAGYLIPQFKFAKESSKLKHFILDCCMYNLDAV